MPLGSSDPKPNEDEDHLELHDPKPKKLTKPLDLGDPLLNEVALHMIAIGKIIEAQEMELATVENGIRKPNKELVLRLGKIINEIEKKKKFKAKEEKEGQEKESFWLKLVKKVFLAKGNDAKAAQMAKQKETSRGVEDSAKAISAELERAMTNLKSASKIDSDRNDLTILQDMTKVLALSAKLTEKMPVFSVQPNPMVERALMSVAEISVNQKYNGIGLMVNEVAGQGLKTNTESFAKSVTLNMNEATGNVNPMIDSLSRNAGKEIIPSAIKPTAAVIAQKAQENSGYINPSLYGRDKT